MFKSRALFALIALSVTAFDSGEAVNLVPRKAVITPYTLYDQAVEKLLELKLVVDSAVLTSRTQFDEIENTHDNYGNNVQALAVNEIQEEAQKNAGYLSDLKDIANMAGVNIATCLRGREDFLNRLPDLIINELQLCIIDVHSKAQDTITQGKRIIDTNYDIITDLTAQLQACVTGSILCVSPVVRNIDAATIQLPENIAKQVHTTSDLVSTLTLEVDECSSAELSSYVTGANVIVSEIGTCVNDLV